MRMDYFRCHLQLPVQQFEHLHLNTSRNQLQVKLFGNHQTVVAELASYKAAAANTQIVVANIAAIGTITVAERRSIVTANITTAINCLQTKGNLPLGNFGHVLDRNDRCIDCIGLTSLFVLLVQMTRSSVCFF
jgi:hypothetical protein